MDEFALIRTFFAPLAEKFPGSLNLTDDAALINIPTGKELVITKDAISEGVHFIGSEDPALIARKLLRVNLSDLAAMGAQPLAYLLAVMLPKKTNANWIKKFAKGLAEDQRLFGIDLTGGDTTAAPGAMGFSVTALGTVAKGKALKRSGANIGDDIYVSGAIGDSALGLLCLKKKLPLNRYLQQRYLLPQPRVALGQKLHGIATACIDISDGLMQDLDHVCHASKVSAQIHRHSIPVSSSAATLIKKDTSLWKHVLGGGDDYELLFTARPDKAKDIASLARNLKLPLTKIGRIVKGNKVTLLDEKGAAITPPKTGGYKHF